MKKLLSTLFISSALLFVGCEGDEGPQGPAGADGNANVKSETFSIAPSEWQLGSGVMEYHHTSAFINADLLNNGVVHVYQLYTPPTTPGENTEYLQLPVSYNTQSGSARVDFEHFVQSPDTLTITSQIAWSDTQTFKVVTIDGNPARYKPEVDFGNYEMVKEYFGLED